MALPDVTQEMTRSFSAPRSRKFSLHDPTHPPHTRALLFLACMKLGLYIDPLARPLSTLLPALIAAATLCDTRCRVLTHELLDSLRL
eukprot:2746475-Pleurochrysis_carterae.AAC.1